MQQKAPIIKVIHLIEQNSIVRKLKTLAATVYYQRPTLSTEFELLVLVFLDASKVDGNVQPGCA